MQSWRLLRGPILQRGSHAFESRDAWGLGVECKPMINKPCPFKGLNIRIPITIPITRKGFIDKGSTLVGVAFGVCWFQCRFFITSVSCGCSSCDDLQFRSPLKIAA